MIQWSIETSPERRSVMIQTGESKEILVCSGNAPACFASAPKACPRKLAFIFDSVVENQFRGKKKTSSLAVVDWRGGTLLIRRRGLQFSLSVKSFRTGGVCGVCRVAFEKQDGAARSCSKCGSVVHIACTFDDYSCPVCNSVVHEKEASNV